MFARSPSTMLFWRQQDKSVRTVRRRREPRHNKKWRRNETIKIVVEIDMHKAQEHNYIRDESSTPNG